MAPVLHIPAAMNETGAMAWLLRLAPCVLLLVTGCSDEGGTPSGGTGGQPGSGGSGGSGASTGSGATGSGGGECPALMPEQDAPCSLEGQNCSYGDCCPAGATCTDGKWQTWASGCAEQQCPDEPPASGDACVCFASPTCGWDHCAGDGTTVTATCGDAGWAVTSEPCGPIPCGTEGLECNPGELCVGKAGGAGIFYSCAPNPCPDQPLSCGCAGASLCGTDTCAVVSAQEISCSCLDCP